MGAIGVFIEEQQAYDLVMNLSWILPTIVVIGALLDALFVTVYMEFAHPWKDILAEHESSMFLHKVPKYLSSIFCKVLQYLSLILRKVPQFLRYLFLLINNIGPKVVYFAPVIFCLIHNMNNYHAATFSLTSNTLTSFNANSKCLEKK